MIWSFTDTSFLAIPVQALRSPGCQPYTLAAFTPKEIFLVPIAFIGWVNSRAIVWLEGLFQPKIPVTPWGIKPVTSQHVGQCLNQLCHPVPPQTHITQFTFANTHYGKYICDIHKFSTRSELHYSKHRTYNQSLTNVHKLNCSCLLSKTV